MGTLENAQNHTAWCLEVERHTTIADLESVLLEGIWEGHTRLLLIRSGDLAVERISALAEHAGRIAEEAGAEVRWLGDIPVPPLRR